MTVSLETLIDRSVNNMGKGIHPVVKESAVEVIRRAYKEGIYVQFSSGYRSNEEQQRLYNQGRTTPGNVVTNARPGESLHNYGLAIDYFLVSADGKQSLWSVNNNWRRVAAIGKSLGFEWGGDWRGFVDYPHLQMTGGLSLSQLQAGKKPNLISKVDPSNTKPITPNTPAFEGLVEYMKSKGMYTSFANREKLAKEYGIKNYTGTASQNIELLNALKKGPIKKEELSMGEVDRLQKQIDELTKKLSEKKDKESISNTPDPAHAGAWEWAKVKGLLNGERPHETVTREQLATILKRFSK